MISGWRSFVGFLILSYRPSPGFNMFCSGKCPTDYRTVGLACQNLPRYIQDMGKLLKLALGWLSAVMFPGLNGLNVDGQRFG